MEDSQIYTSKKLKDEKIDQEENLDDDEDENKNNPELFFSLMNESKYDIENMKEIPSVK